MERRNVGARSVPWITTRLAAAAFAFFFPSDLRAHPGRLDSNGCHVVHRTGEYHCHDGSGSGGGGGGGGGAGAAEASRHRGGSAGYGGSRDSGYDGPACGGELENPSAFRAAVESLARACYANAYVRERGIESAMLDLEVRVRESTLKVTTFEGLSHAGVEQCIRAELGRLRVRTNDGCVDQYFRVPLRAPRIGPPSRPVTMEEATFVLLASLEPDDAPVDPLLNWTWAHVVPPSRMTQVPVPVDLFNLVLVEPGREASFEPVSPGPPPTRRGDVARVWLYMLHAYGVTLSQSEASTLSARGIAPIRSTTSSESAIDESRGCRETRIRSSEPPDEATRLRARLPLAPRGVHVPLRTTRERSDGARPRDGIPRGADGRDRSQRRPRRRPHSRRGAPRVRRRQLANRRTPDSASPDARPSERRDGHRRDRRPGHRCRSRRGRTTQPVVRCDGVEDQPRQLAHRWRSRSEASGPAWRSAEPCR